MIREHKTGRKIRSIQKQTVVNPGNAYTEFPKDEPGVIYVRQSKLVQKENNIHSFEMQTEKFEEYFREQLKCSNHIEIIADDEGLSGTLSIHERKGLTRVMRLINGEELINGQRIGWIGAVHVNRLSRDKWLVTPGTIMMDCYKNNVWVATLRMLFNFQDSYCQRVFLIEAEESARHLEWMKLVMGGGLRTASSHGYYDGRALVPGYLVDRTDEKKKKYMIYEPHAKVVRWLFLRFFELDGNFPKLCREVEAMPYFLPAFEKVIDPRDFNKFQGNRKKKGTRIQDGEHKGNYRITKAGLKSILCNPVYIGWWLPIGGGVVENNHPAIIEEYLFAYAHKRLSTHDLNGNRQKPAQVLRHGSVKNILVQVIKDDRDENMYITVDRGRPYFKSIDFGPLTSKYRFTVDAHEYEELFLEKLFERIKVLENLEWSDNHTEQKSAKVRAQEEAKRNISKEIDRAARQKAEIQDTLDDPDIPKSRQMKIDYAKKIMGLEGKIKQLEIDLAEVGQQENDNDEEILFEIKSLLPGIKSQWGKIDFDIRLRFIRALVLKVVVIPAAPSWRRFEIHWKPAIGDIVDIAHVRKPQTNKRLWSSEEDAILQEFYSTGDAIEILSKIPDRSWQSIYARAASLGIKRERNRQPNSQPVTMEKPQTPEDRKYEEENGILPTVKKVFWQ